MGLDATEWLKVLSKAGTPSTERVIVAGKFSTALRIRKRQWDRHFTGFGGVAFTRGKEIRVVPRASGGPRADVPAWVRDHLGVGPDDGLCVTERGGTFYLKKLQLVEMSSEVPACVIVDTFAPGSVKRSYSPAVPFDQIKHDHLERILSAVGTFRHDPIAPFRHVQGRVGLLARKELLGGWTKADTEAVKAYRKELAEDQLDDGSWHESMIHTAFRLIRLIEVGGTRKHAAVAKGVRRLLESPEPIGFPGLFFCDPAMADKFNQWKEEHTGSDRFTKSGAKHAEQAFANNVDLVGRGGEACETRVYWSSAVVLEALLRCGLARNPRVVRAVRTFLAVTRTGGGRWCGNHIFMAKRDYSGLSGPLDFDCAQVTPAERTKWATNGKDVIEMVADDPDYGHEHYKQWALGKNRAALMRHADEHDGGNCTFIVHRALSWHPGYRGSQLELLGSLKCENLQGWDGAWSRSGLAFAFLMLERLATPLAAFAALRSVPVLIRRQGPDGLWNEAHLPTAHPKTKPPPKEVTTFVVLKTLKKHGFLDALLSR